MSLIEQRKALDNVSAAWRRIAAGARAGARPAAEQLPPPDQEQPKEEEPKKAA